ncbi:Alpha/beta hydrolase family protein [Actinopolyspora mzabensis]|uniref:Alpha/beta hydrolase family protein n=1 Tax=Actinopolyspora mzabensis TaxID=995066 RepID=A0A1G8ZCR8_ACTMZ|nr:alpha/beta fold hydrolase [Actinopolyspora mzabensis]SDK12205.1 Alpha/beta hydrolase family protein [Actinopolyspora mzabensis]
MNESTDEITLDAAGVPLSGLLAEPTHTEPRGVVVALHGAGMRAGYFHGHSYPGQSLLETGTRLGWTVLALDRPGYGSSAHRLPRGQELDEQAATLRAGLKDFTDRYSSGAGLFLLGHSFGGKLVLTVAGNGGEQELLGVDVSGCGHQYAVSPDEISDLHDRRRWWLNWGKLGFYPPGTFRHSESIVTPVPCREIDVAKRWPDIFPTIAARIRVPVRLTFAEQEKWWLHGDESTTALEELFRSTTVKVERQPNAGHNISLGWAARSYHLRAISFAEECLVRRTVAFARK